MRYFLLYITILTSITVSFAQGSVTKPKANEIGFARHFATDYLEARGVNVSNINFILEEYTERLFFFNDMAANAFILMAREEYADFLSDRVLAFSIGVPHSKARDTETFMHLFSYYDKLISDIYSGELPKENRFQVQPLRISPMLYTIRWTQLALDGSCVGQNEDVKYGCGPVALGQLMKYHQWPDKTSGTFSYRDKSGRLQSVNMDGVSIDWTNIPNYILRNTKKDTRINQLMEMIGKAVKADYGHNETSSSSFYFKRALVENFGYSPRMYLVDKHETDETAIVTLIREELEHGRPVILTGGHHVFVCDGAYDDFLHLNMGWGGSYDGWYRFPIVRTSTSKYSFIDTALLNIAPWEGTGQTRSITLDEAGKLATVLSAEECANISDLTIKGKINGDDIRILRRMAGGVEPCDTFSWFGVLARLNLAEAEIVRDTVPYVSTNSRYYDFSKRTREDIIEYQMFAKCDNLESVVLPVNTFSIGNYAFWHNTRIKEITIPSLAKVSATSFCDCTSLEKIRICSDSPLLEILNDSDKKEKLFANCHPAIKVDIDTTLETHAAAKTRYVEQQVSERKDSVKRSARQAGKESDKQGMNYQQGTKIISRYKMVNGKRKLISRKVVPAE